MADTVQRVEQMNVTAIDALCSGAGRYGAMLWVAPPDYKTAAALLGAQ